MKLRVLSSYTTEFTASGCSARTDKFHQSCSPEHITKGSSAIAVHRVNQSRRSGDVSIFMRVRPFALAWPNGVELTSLDGVRNKFFRGDFARCAVWHFGCFQDTPPKCGKSSRSRHDE